jgi:hypothetical protein
MFSRSKLVLLAAAVLVGACAKGEMDDMGSASATPAGSPMSDGAEYTLVFKSTWTAANHPFEYPSANPISGPHFSGIIGAAHNGSFSLFREGAMPTQGLEALSETGKHTPLDSEIRAAESAGAAANLFTSGPLKDFGDSIVTVFRVDDRHPMVSFAAMIAPSPDWFTGAADVNLMENGAWASSKTLQLYAWDSGGDDGASYKAADRDNDPKKPVTQSMSRHFAMNARAVPVATVTLTRK